MGAGVLVRERLCWCSWPQGCSGVHVHLSKAMCTSAKPTAVRLAVLQMSTGLRRLACGVLIAAPGLLM